MVIGLSRARASSLMAHRDKAGLPCQAIAVLLEAELRSSGKGGRTHDVERTDNKGVAAA